MMNRSEFLLKIGFSAEKYRHDVFECYFVWCEAYSYNDKTHQKLLSNSKMFNWWMRQYKILEGIAFTIAQDNPKLPKEELRAIYNRQIVKIKNYYPKAKINEVLQYVKPAGKYSYRSYTQSSN